jgi:hypothetical protein
VSAPAQHTPGPWQITAEGGAIVGHEGGTLVVETGLAYWQNLAATTAQAGSLACRHVPEVMANARLIAETPNLLAALRKAETWIATFSDQVGNPTGPLANDLAEIRAAIARATA